MTPPERAAPGAREP